MNPVSSFSWVTAGSCPAHSNPPSTKQDYITYYIFILFVFYQFWWIHDLPVLDHELKTYSFLFSHSILQQVRDWNIQSCHGWWRHPWLLSSWHFPLQYPRAPRVLTHYSFSYASQNPLPRCYYSWCKLVYLHSGYTGYQYPFLTPYTTENYDRYQCDLYKYLLACSLI